MIGRKPVYNRRVNKTDNGIDYENFLRAKACIAPASGNDIIDGDINDVCKPHQKAVTRWAVHGGCRALFASFGLGKTIMQLEIIRLILNRNPDGKGLIVAPLNVRGEFIRDGKEKLGLNVKFIRRIEEAEGADIYITNYETIRDGKLNPAHFVVASLDEAAILRGFAGTKTFREFMRVFSSVKYRFVATATPSPNEYVELLAYADYLGVMDTSQAKTRFFKRDSTKADKLTIHEHKEQEFWLWVSSWAIFVQKPSDVTGNPADDVGYDLPNMKVIWHEVDIKDRDAGMEKWGQYKMLREPNLNLQDASREKRDSLNERIDKMLEIVGTDAKSHYLIWHDLEAERHAITKALPEAQCIWGSQDLEEREQYIADFSDGKISILAGKPVMLGSGCNFQRYCHKAIFLGVGFKFKDFIQSIHRIYRFLQKEEVEIHIIYTSAERGIRKQLEKKWQNHNTLVKKMTDIIKQYGLSETNLYNALIRALGVERVEIKGENYTIVNNDSVLEMSQLETNSVGLILSSIPFSSQYEYSPNYADFGHSDNNAHFWEQMNYLTPNLLRVLKPGRICAIHVKDRIIPGGLTGLGFQTVYPFHVDAINHFEEHGFGYMGMKTIVTDVVRENNQTYRLGWTEQCKDGSKMGVGMPEYLLLFRKPPTDTTNSYADEPVIKSKQNYTRSKWQIDAHGFTRSSGDRLMNPEELKNLEHSTIFQLFKQYSLEDVYNFKHHVKIGETLDEAGMLPVTFMLLQPQSWSEEVWSDITRMLTLNGRQYAKGKEMHLCPMQFDIADRVIEQMSNEGDLVLDPFAGLGTVPMRAMMQGRKGFGIELSHNYFLDAAAYLRATEEKMNMPSLFDVVEIESKTIGTEVTEEKPSGKKAKRKTTKA